jgi:hypothetical protein
MCLVDRPELCLAAGRPIGPGAKMDGAANLGGRAI